MWTDTARAKVNLTLRVLGRRSDGFHELESIVAFADVGDHLTLSLDRPAGVSVTGRFAAAIEGENLVTRALDRAAAAAPGIALGHVAIDKRLPVAAGVGGGSADAAAALRLIRRANPAIAGQIDWAAMAAELGSDVPVCLADRACRMTGRGEILTPIANRLALPAVLVNPMVAVPADKTRQVFRLLAAPSLQEAPAVRAAPLGAVADWCALLAQSGNDLQNAATSVVPAVAEVLAALDAAPATRLARLSGAGPTCFALVATAAEATALAENLATLHPTWWVQATTLN